MLLPLLLFFWQQLLIPPLPPARLPHFSGVQTISTFHGISENVIKDVCTAVKIGAVAGLGFSAVSWKVQQTHTTTGRDLHYLVGAPCHSASIGGSFCVRTNFLRLHEVLKQLGAKTIQNRQHGLSIMLEGTFTYFQSLDLERFLRTKWRKAFPSLVQLSGIPGHHPKSQEEWSQPLSAPRGPSPAPEMPPSCREPLHYLRRAMAGGVSVV